MKTRFRISTTSCTESYSTTDRISWAHPENAYKNQVFADEVRNIQTFDKEYYGCVVVKEDKRSGCQGAAAIIICSPAGQIALGAPGPKTKSNGEQTLCHNLNMVDAATRRALHGSPIFSEVTTELKELVQAKLIEDGLLRVGGTVAAITEWELRADTSDELRALAALLAARGFVCRAGGQLIIFLAANEDMIDAEFKTEPRSLGNTMHGLEYLEKARWGRWRRYGPTEVVPTDSEQLNELKKVRAEIAAKGGKVIKVAHANVKSGKATEREKAIVKKAIKGRKVGHDKAAAASEAAQAKMRADPHLSSEQALIKVGLDNAPKHCFSSGTQTRYRCKWCTACTPSTDAASKHARRYHAEHFQPKQRCSSSYFCVEEAH